MGELIVFLILLGLGYGFGQLAERRHYKSIQQREAELRRIRLVAARSPDPSLKPLRSQLVTGSVVVSVDFFKHFVAGLRNLIGGRVTPYESLLDRARREAILRMKQQAAEVHADIIFNMKLETSSISKGRKNTVGAVEVLAYGTALISTEAGS